MKYYDEDQAKPLREAIEREVLHWPEVTLRKMFGCPAYTVDGRLFAFVVTEGIVITQLRLKDREALAEDHQTESFKAGERVMERWVKVFISDLNALGRLMSFVRKSYQSALAEEW